MKKVIVLSFVVALLGVAAIATSSRSSAKLKCPLVTLSNPPGTLKTGLGKTCANSLTVSTNNCPPYTFTFTWAGGGYSQQSTTGGSSTLTFYLPSMGSGTSIDLVVTDGGGGSSGTYNFTSVYCN